MNAREKIEAEEKKLEIYNIRGAVCEVCGKRVLYTEAQIAHRIPKTKGYLKKYGKKIMHHKRNLALVCSLECNSAVNVGNNFIKVRELIDRIKEEL